MAKAKASFHWDDPLLLEQQLSDDELATLLRLTERYCVVYQTLAGGVPVEISVAAGS